MKVKSSLIIAVLCCAMGLSACNTKEEDTESLNAGSVTQISELPDFSGELDFEYVYETDCQTAQGDYPMKAYTTDGTYSIYPLEDEWNLEGRRLCFYDNASDQTVVVCSKSNCAHSDYGCDAFFDKNEYPIDGIWYYSGNLYMPAVDGDYLCVNRISLDGTAREKSCTLMRLDIQTRIEDDGSESTWSYYPSIQMHRGYAYFSTYYPGCSNVELWRVKLDSEEEAELLFSFNGENPVLCRIKPYGRYVLFQLGSFSDEAYMDGTLEILAYDTEGSDEISCIYADFSREYTIAADDLYCLDMEYNVIRKDFSTGKTELFYENEKEISESQVTLFGCGDSLVYQLSGYQFDEETGNATESVEQIVLDKNGNVTDTLRTEDGNLLSLYER